MSLESGFKEQDTVVDKYHAPNADYEMSVRDYTLRPSADGGSGAITISLPPVAQARGKFYSIVVRNADAVNTITVQDRDDSECWVGDITWNGKCDGGLFYSDGLMWHVFGLPYSPGGYATTPPPGTTPTPTTAPATAGS